MRRLCGGAAGKRFLRGAFFCGDKRKRPSDSPPGCARRRCETSRWAVVRTCRPVTSPSGEFSVYGAYVTHCQRAQPARPRRLRCAGFGLATWGRYTCVVRRLFPFESHGRAAPPALSPSGEKRRRGRMIPAAPRYAATQRLPCKGSWRGATEGSAAKISCFAAFDFPRCPGRSQVSAAPRRRLRCGGAAFRGGRWRGGYCAPPRWCGARRRA